MVEHIRNSIAFLIAPKIFRTAQEQLRIAKKERESIITEINIRVAKIVSEMDPFEPLMKQFNGVFSKEFEHPEDKLDARSQLMMMTWAYQQREDPSFKYMNEWIMNTQGNETLKRAPVTEARIQYGRAQISSILLYVKEVGRLASLYEDMMEKKKNGENFDSELPIE